MYKYASFDVFFDHRSARLTTDSEATGNMIRASTVKNFNTGIQISNSSQSAHQADGSSPLKIIGEARMSFTRVDHILHSEGLVVENLDVEILAGIPFMERNDIFIRPSIRQIAIGNDTFRYGSVTTSSDRHVIRRAHVLPVPAKTTTVWPGEFIEIDLPEDMSSSGEILAIEPHVNTRANTTQPCPTPSLVTNVSGKVRIPNVTDEPMLLKRNEHFCDIRSAMVKDANDIEHQAFPAVTRKQVSLSQHSDRVQLDPDNVLSPDMKAKFKETLREYDSVFDSKFQGYNGAVSPFEAKVIVGPVQPPQRKGRVPQYSRNQLVELQQQFDELENIGVLSVPKTSVFQLNI